MGGMGSMWENKEGTCKSIWLINLAVYCFQRSDIGLNNIFLVGWTKNLIQRTKGNKNQ